MLKYIFALFAIFLCLTSCNSKPDRQAAMDYLCQYDKQILLLNENAEPLKSVVSEGIQRIKASPDDRRVVAAFMDSVQIAVVVYDKKLDQCIRNMEAIKPIDDKSQLVSRSVSKYKDFSVFLKTDFNRLCVEGKDSLMVNAEWGTKYITQLERMINIVKEGGDFQGDFQDQFAFTAEEIKAIEDCTKK